MPPVRKPRQRAQTARSTAPETEQSPQDEAPSGFSGSTSKVSSPPAGKNRVKNEPLRVKVEHTYMAIGLAIQPLGKFWPILNPLGKSIRNYSEEASEAWLTLAEDDPKYMRLLQSMTSYSAIGEVIGVHVAIGLQSLPQSQFVMEQMAQQQNQQNNSLAEMQARAEQIRQANAMPADMPARDTSTGGPGDTVRVPPAPTFSPQAVPNQPVQTPTTTAVPTGTPKRAAIVSPAQMGVQIPGEQGSHPFSAAPPPNGRAQQG